MNRFLAVLSGTVVLSVGASGNLQAQREPPQLFSAQPITTVRSCPPPSARGMDLTPSPPFSAEPVPQNRLSLAATSWRLTPDNPVAVSGHMALVFGGVKATNDSTASLCGAGGSVVVWVRSPVAGVQYSFDCVMSPVSEQQPLLFTYSQPLVPNPYRTITRTNKHIYFVHAYGGDTRVMYYMFYRPSGEGDWVFHGCDVKRLE